LGAQTGPSRDREDLRGELMAHRFPDADEVNHSNDQAIQPAPPQGRLAEKRDKLARDHPRLYASRHVVFAVLEVVIGFVGVSAILFGLLPRLDVPTLPWPDLSISVPNWARTILAWPDTLLSEPVAWVRSGRAWLASIISLPGWISTFVQSASWWGPILIAVFVAVREAKRRQR
jgi:hypothetical protein